MKEQPIESAPKDGTRVLVYNEMTGWYESAYEHGEWPLRGKTENWGHEGGVWYPRPSTWKPIEARGVCPRCGQIEAVHGLTTSCSYYTTANLDASSTETGE